MDRSALLGWSFAVVFASTGWAQVTQRVSVGTGSEEGNFDSYEPAISADGRYVAFWGYASNLVPGDTNLTWDVFVRDRRLGTTERVSVDSSGAQGNGGSGHAGLSISSYGRYVAFTSRATNLVPGDTNGVYDVFVRDRRLGTTERASVDFSGMQGNGDGYDPSISADGRCVAFRSSATNLVPGEFDLWGDVFVRDRQLGTTELMNVDSAGAQGAYNYSYSPSIPADGRDVTFWSYMQNLVPGDTNGRGDVFVRDRLGGPSFTSLCDPGAGGVIACPCSNPPVGPGRGCDNSSARGGAILSAFGGTYLSSDSLVFTASGVNPSALAIVVQGTTSLASGAVYGQGVRCAGGAIERLYTKTASAGSVTGPDFGANDPTVSARSAPKGDVIRPGQSRWYFVFYRDLTVLGGCPPSSTFNATQTGAVAWSP